MATILDLTTAAKRRTIAALRSYCQGTAANARVEWIRSDQAPSDRRGTPNANSKSDRMALLKSSRAGEHVQLSVDIVATREPDKPNPLPASMAHLANANFTRFRIDEMEAFGNSFAGRPFLRDHSSKTTDRGGKISESSSVQVDDGEHVMVQTLDVVKPEFVQGILDGTLEEFSIGWEPKTPGLAGFMESAQCTVCGCGMFDPASSCSHWPGDVVSLKQEDGKSKEFIAELEWTNVVGREVSAVTFPAVQGTGVEDFQAVLGELRATYPKKDQTMYSEAIKKHLGLASTATDAEVEAKLAANTQELADAKLQRDASAESATAARTELETERTRQAQIAATELSEKVAATREDALKRGLFGENTSRSALFDKLAERDLADAVAFVASLEPILPVGQPSQTSRSIEPAKSGQGQGVRSLSAWGQKQAKHLGVTDSMLANAEQED